MSERCVKEMTKGAGEAIDETECFVIVVRSCNEAVSEVVVVLLLF